MIDKLLEFVPSAGAMLVTVLGLWVINRFLERRPKTRGRRFRHQLILLGLTFAGMLFIVLMLPLGDAKRGQLFSLMGILLSATIALSSTTFLGNAMAGVMLRAVRNFRTGDFIQCDQHFGRVSERGLFHTEIQDEDRQLITLPNLYLVTHAVTTVRTSGTIVAAETSLGYDVSRARIKRLLLEAAERAELTDAFVQIRELGDFSVTYRIAGMLADVKTLLTARSRLRGCVMDVFHEHDVEIVSPNFMNQRVLDARQAFIPAIPVQGHADEQADELPEELVFDKAEEAASLEVLQQSHGELHEQMSELQSKIKKAETDEMRERLERELQQLELRDQRLTKVIDGRIKKVAEKE